MTLDLMSLSFNILVHERLRLSDLTFIHRQNEIASPINAYPIHAFKGKIDYSWVHAWRNNEIILDLLLVAIVNQIHTGVDILILDFTVGRYIRMPFLRIIADEVIIF